MNYGVHFGASPIEMSDTTPPDDLEHYMTACARMREALVEIASQCHNLPRGKTADRIDTLARAALAGDKRDA